MKNYINNKMNNHIKFWLTIGSLVTLVSTFIFMLYIGSVEQISFRKEYCIFILPIFLYNGFQFIINYINLTEE